MIGSSFYEEDDRITAQNAAKTQRPSGGIVTESVGIVAIKLGVTRMTFTLNEGDKFGASPSTTRPSISIPVLTCDIGSTC